MIEQNPMTQFKIEGGGKVLGVTKFTNFSAFVPNSKIMPIRLRKKMGLIYHFKDNKGFLKRCEKVKHVKKELFSQYF